MDALTFLHEHKQAEGSAFITQAQFLRDNWDWLKYSYAIAIRIRHRMEETGMTQKQLAEAMNCTQQHVSSLLGGRNNMTLETIAKLEKALGIPLIGTAMTDAMAPGMLNDSSLDSQSEKVNTSTLVTGYKTRKKKGPKK